MHAYIQNERESLEREREREREFDHTVILREIYRNTHNSTKNQRKSLPSQVKRNSKSRTNKHIIIRKKKKKKSSLSLSLL